jgi:hypothetical protein
MRQFNANIAQRYGNRKLTFGYQEELINGEFLPDS